MIRTPRTGVGDFGWSLFPATSQFGRWFSGAGSAARTNLPKNAPHTAVVAAKAEVPMALAPPYDPLPPSPSSPNVCGHRHPAAGGLRGGHGSSQGDANPSAVGRSTSPSPNTLSERMEPQ